MFAIGPPVIALSHLPTAKFPATALTVPVCMPLLGCFFTSGKQLSTWTTIRTWVRERTAWVFVHLRSIWFLGLLASRLIYLDHRDPISCRLKTPLSIGLLHQPLSQTLRLGPLSALCQLFINTGTCRNTPTRGKPCSSPALGRGSKLTLLAPFAPAAAYARRQRACTPSTILSQQYVLLP